MTLNDIANTNTEKIPLKRPSFSLHATRILDQVQIFGVMIACQNGSPSSLWEVVFSLYILSYTRFIAKVTFHVGIG